jgi:hypothetical protein
LDGPPLGPSCRQIGILSVTTPRSEPLFLLTLRLVAISGSVVQATRMHRYGSFGAFECKEHMLIPHMPPLAGLERHAQFRHAAQLTMQNP